MAVAKLEETITWFPNPGQVMAFKDDIIAQLARTRQFDKTALPENTDSYSEEELAQNQKKIQIIKDQLCGKLTMDEALAKQNKLVTFSATR